MGVGQSETDVEDVCDTVAVVVQPASGDVLQFLKAGIMEVPDLLVVTKADLGDAAARSRRDLAQALAAVGSSECRCSPSRRWLRQAGSRSWRTRSTPTGMARTSLSGACAPAAGRPCGSSTAEHGERALRELGGRREAERLLERQDQAAGVTELVSALEAGR